MAEISQRPGVYSQYTLSSAYGRGMPQGAALVAAKGTQEETGKLNSFTNLRELKEWAGYQAESPCHKAGALLLEQGVGKVFLFTLGEDTAPLAEQAAALKEIGAIVTDIVDEAVLKKLAMEEGELASGQLGRIVFTGAETVEASIQLAGKVASARCCLCYPPMAIGEKESSLYTAAAFAAKVLLSESPAHTLNWVELEGVICSKTLTEDEINRLIAGGVTPFENWQGRVQCIRAVTTGTVAEKGMKSLNTVLIIDHVMAYLRENLTLLLKNSRGRTLGKDAIAAQAAVLLGNKQDEGLITYFETPVAAASLEDPSVCVLTVGFQTAAVVDIIRIDATIRI